MKTNILVFLLLIVSICESENDTWVVTYGEDLTTYATSQVVLDDGSVIIAGYYNGQRTKFGNTNLTLNGELNSFLAKINVDGNLEWVRSVGSGGVTYLTEIKLEKQSQQIIAVGDFGNFTSSSESKIETANGIVSSRGRDSFVLRIELNGNILSGSTITEYPSYKIKSFDIDLEGAIYLMLESDLAANLLVPNQFNSEVKLLKINKDFGIQTPFLSHHELKGTGIKIISTSLSRLKISIREKEFMSSVYEVENSKIIKKITFKTKESNVLNLSSMLIDDYGNTFLTGSFSNGLSIDGREISSAEESFNKTNQDRLRTVKAFIIKLNNEDELNWYSISNTVSTSINVEDIDISNNGYVSITGTSVGAVDFQSKKTWEKKSHNYIPQSLFIAKFDSLGTNTTTYQDKPSVFSSGKSITYFNGYIYLSGRIGGEGRIMDHKIGKDEGTNFYIGKIKF